MRTRLISSPIAFLAIALLLPLLPGAGGVARAQVGWRPNGFAPGTAGLTVYGTILSDGAGGAFVAWTDYRDGDGDLYVQRYNSLGIAQWTAGGVLVSGAASDQFLPGLVSDGSGGVIVAWDDLRNGNLDIFVRRVDSAGVPQWAADGVALCTAAGSQLGNFAIGLATDGAGGAIVTWKDDRVADRDIYARRVNSAGVAQWAANGVVVCGEGSTQDYPALAADGAGGAILAWEDRRSGTTQIFMQRIDAAGTAQWDADGEVVFDATVSGQFPQVIGDGGTGAIIVRQSVPIQAFGVRAQRVNSSGTPQWAANGVVLSALETGLEYPWAVPDGSGGAIVAWGSGDITANRVNASGVLQWGSTGLSVCSASGSQDAPFVASDDAGGVIVAWRDQRNGNYDVFAQRLNGSGAAQWTADGVAVCNASGTQQSAWATTDGAGGAILVWDDRRTSFDAMIHRVLPNGLTADFIALLTAVVDLPDDQGGWARLDVYGAPADAGYAGVTGYNVWRLVPALATARLEPACRVDRGELGARGLARCERGPAWLAPAEAEDVGFPAGTWESMGFHAATQSASYLLAAPTRDDFTGGAPTDETYVVSVHSATPWLYYVTDAASGHSLDNLAPAMPLNLAGTFQGPSTVELAWDPNPEGDLSHYAVYEGSDPDFVPSAGNRIGTPVSPAFTDDSFGPTSHYKVSAIDIHGNESGSATLGPGQVTDVPAAGAPAASYLGHAAPNPFRDVATIEIGLSRAGPAVLRVADLGGRLVRALRAGPLPAGVHRLKWDGRDGSGVRVRSGLYLVSLDSPGVSRSLKLLLVE